MKSINSKTVFFFTGACEQYTWLINVRYASACRPEWELSMCDVTGSINA